MQWVLDHQSPRLLEVECTKCKSDRHGGKSTKESLKEALRRSREECEELKKINKEEIRAMMKDGAEEIAEQFTNYNEQDDQVNESSPNVRRRISPPENEAGGNEGANTITGDEDKPTQYDGHYSIQPIKNAMHKHLFKIYNTCNLAVLMSFAEYVKEAFVYFACSVVVSFAKRGITAITPLFTNVSEFTGSVFKKVANTCWDMIKGFVKISRIFFYKMMSALCNKDHFQHTPVGSTVS